MVFQSLGRIQVIGRATTENLYLLRQEHGMAYMCFCWGLVAYF